MKIVDLSQPLHIGMPTYPGTETPRFDTVATVETNGWLEKNLVCSSHTGTHVDAPAHILADGVTLDRLPLSRFFGSAICMNVSGITGNQIDRSVLEPYGGQLADADFALIHTHWSRKWGGDDYFIDHPCLNSEGAEFLASFNLSGVGIDTSSFDAADSTELPIHRTLLGKGLILIENLTNLETIGTDRCEFGCFPLKLTVADGSPVRAFALMPDSVSQS